MKGNYLRPPQMLYTMKSLTICEKDVGLLKVQVFVLHSDCSYSDFITCFEEV